jgi:hypothetical protein
VHPGCNNSGSTFGMFATDNKHQVSQPLSQFFASQLINLEWLKPGHEVHELYSAEGDIEDAAGHKLVTAYAVKRPDGQWALLMVNRDQENSHSVSIKFHNADSGRDGSFSGSVDTLTFGSAQYHWDPLRKIADPDGPVLKSRITGDRSSSFQLPAASLVVVRGSMKLQ